jgi:Fe(3+) dicitrate transport protein
VLTGADSTSAAEELVLGTNERDFWSGGLQLVATTSAAWWGVAHEIEAGLRFHYDQADRYHWQASYAMSGGRLVRSTGARTVTRDGVGSAMALAAYYQHHVTLGDFRVTAGARTEAVATRWSDHADPSASVSGSYVVFLPGAGVIYQPVDSLGFLAGVHTGFVPVAPGEEDGAAPERSINYEAGGRWSIPGYRAEVIGFFSDYSNLKGTCSVSSGCDPVDVDREFNGGKVHILGVEAMAAAELDLGPVMLPLTASYTFTHATFENAFMSANPQWGTVEVGDEVPYLPRHQLAVSAAVRGKRWQLAATGRHVSAMRDVAGQGPIPEHGGTDALTVLDLAASVDVPGGGKVYATVDNVFNQHSVVARRPFGVRPGVPLLLIVGYKHTF